MLSIDRDSKGPGNRQLSIRHHQPYIILQEAQTPSPIFFSEGRPCDFRWIQHDRQLPWHNSVESVMRAGRRSESVCARERYTIGNGTVEATSCLLAESVHAHQSTDSKDVVLIARQSTDWIPLFSTFDTAAHYTHISIPSRSIIQHTLRAVV